MRLPCILYPPALLISIPIHDTLVKKRILSHVMDAEHHPPGLVEMRHLLQGTPCNSLHCPTIRFSIQRGIKKNVSRCFSCIYNLAMRHFTV